MHDRVVFYILDFMYMLLLIDDTNKYIYLCILRITMCPHGYHHSGSMATPALGTRDVRLHIVWIAL